MLETDIDEVVNKELLTWYIIKKDCLTFRLLREIFLIVVVWFQQPDALCFFVLIHLIRFSYVRLYNHTIFSGVLCRIAVDNGQTPVREITDMLCGLIEDCSPFSTSKGTQTSSSFMFNQEKVLKFPL